MKKIVPIVPSSALAASLPAAAPRLVYAAPKLNVIGDIAKITKTSVSDAFFFRYLD